MIKCIIFDCDGTLVDSEFLCNLGLEIKLREYEIESSAYEMMEKYRGGKLADILQTIESEYDIKLKENFILEYRVLVEELFEKELKPCKGVPEFLNQNTLSVCVASSGPITKINKALSITGLMKYFGRHIFSSYEINSWKPKPDLFLYAAKEMGFLTSECMIVEDSLLGIEAGLVAKIKTVLYDPLKLHKPIDEIDRIEEMDELHHIISTHNKMYSS